MRLTVLYFCNYSVRSQFAVGIIPICKRQYLRYLRLRKRIALIVCHSWRRIMHVAVLSELSLAPIYRKYRHTALWHNDERPFLCDVVKYVITADTSVESSNHSVCSNLCRRGDFFAVFVINLIDKIIGKINAIPCAETVGNARYYGRIAADAVGYKFPLIPIKHQSGFVYSPFNLHKRRRRSVLPSEPVGIFKTYVDKVFACVFCLSRAAEYLHIIANEIIEKVLDVLFCTVVRHPSLKGRFCKRRRIDNRQRRAQRLRLIIWRYHYKLCPYSILAHALDVCFCNLVAKYIDIYVLHALDLRRQYALDWVYLLVGVGIFAHHRFIFEG